MIKFSFLSFLYCFLLAPQQLRAQSVGDDVRAPVTLTNGQYLENCLGDRGGLVNGAFVVRNSAGKDIYRHPRTGWTYFAVDVIGNIFLQGSSTNNIEVLAAGDGAQFNYQLVLDNFGDLVLTNLQTMLINYATPGNRLDPLNCPPTGCDVPAEGDCGGCVTAVAPAGKKCVYCANQRTCFESPTYACPSNDATIATLAACSSTTTPPRLTPGAVPTTTTTRRPTTTLRPMTFTTGLTRKFTGTTGTIQAITLTLSRALFTQPDESAEAPSDEESGLQQGVIIGAAIGAVLCILLVLMLMAFFIYRNYAAGKRRRLAGATNPNSFDAFYQPNQAFAPNAMNHPQHGGSFMAIGGSFVPQQPSQSFITPQSAGGTVQSVQTVATIQSAGPGVAENYMLASNDGIMSARERGPTAMMSAREEQYPSQAYGISVANDAYGTSRRPTFAPAVEDPIGTYGVRQPRAQLPDF
jgi:hypothetical protein